MSGAAGSSQWMYASGDYEIDQSLRFNDDDTATLNRTPASAGNRRTFTTSIWFKLSQVTSSVRLFTAQAAAGGTPFYTIDVFQDVESDNRGIRVNSSANSDELMLITDGRLRDVSAWYHLVAAVDTTQGTSSNRCKIYLNGVQLTDFATETYPSQNYETPCNNTIRHNIGAQGNGNNPFDGYMAEFNHIDGQALTPADFGETGTYGEWKPIEYDGTYGTNGFYLNFAGGGVMSATGGNSTATDGDYKVASFTSSGTFTPSADGYVEYLVIAGGGSGGGAPSRYGSGGGAGGYRTGFLPVTGSTGYTVTVGAGGVVSSNVADKGDDSVFGSITSTGGGRGTTTANGTNDYTSDVNGGSGGGAGTYGQGSAGTGISGQGNNGGAGSSAAATGGGGGAGGVGGTAEVAGSEIGGLGGAGLASSITGSSVTRAGGGGGGGWLGTGHAGSAGGSGGGGRGNGHGNAGTDGTANTGSGGGGGGYGHNGGNGGSGIVIIRYKFQ